jgi:hypothetical protein
MRTVALGILLIAGAAAAATTPAVPAPPRCHTDELSGRIEATPLRRR